MTAAALSYNVPSTLATPFDANKINAVQPVSAQMANGWVDNSDIVKATDNNYLHNASTSLLWVMQNLGLLLPFNPDGTGHSLVATPKGGMVSVKDSATGATFIYVAQNAMPIGYVDPSTDPTNWTYLNLPVLSKFVPAYADAAGTPDAITASYTVVYPVLQDGMVLALGVSTPNTTGTPTFAPTINGSAQTPRVIIKFVAGAVTQLAPGDLQGTVELYYDSINLRWILTTANTGGNANQSFLVANATLNTHAVSLGQADGRYAFPSQVFGTGQSWQSFTALQRLIGVTYTNTASKIRWVAATFQANTTNANATLTTSGITAAYFSCTATPANFSFTLCCPVLPGQTYSVTTTNSSINFIAWNEIS